MAPSRLLRAVVVGLAALTTASHAFLVTPEMAKAVEDAKTNTIEEHKNTLDSAGIGSYDPEGKSIGVNLDNTMYDPVLRGWAMAQTVSLPCPGCGVPDHQLENGEWVFRGNEDSQMIFAFTVLWGGVRMNAQIIPKVITKYNMEMRDLYVANTSAPIPPLAFHFKGLDLPTVTGNVSYTVEEFPPDDNGLGLRKVRIHIYRVNNQFFDIDDIVLTELIIPDKGSMIQSVERVPRPPRLPTPDEIYAQERGCRRARMRKVARELLRVSFYLSIAVFFAMMVRRALRARAARAEQAQYILVQEQVIDEGADVLKEAEEGIPPPPPYEEEPPAYVEKGTGMDVDETEDTTSP